MNDDRSKKRPMWESALHYDLIWLTLVAALTVFAVMQARDSATQRRQIRSLKQTNDRQQAQIDNQRALLEKRAWRPHIDDYRSSLIIDGDPGRE
jgi:hypothetical protein